MRVQVGRAHRRARAGEARCARRGGASRRVVRSRVAGEAGGGGGGVGEASGGREGRDGSPYHLPITSLSPPYNLTIFLRADPSRPVSPSQLATHTLS